MSDVSAESPRSEYLGDVAGIMSAHVLLTFTDAAGYKNVKHTVDHLLLNEDTF